MRETLTIVGLLLLIAGCHGLTEYEGTLHAGVVFVRADDLTIDRVMEGFGDCRALLPLDESTLYVMGYQGTLFRVDTDSMRVDTMLAIWSGPALGPVAMISPYPNEDIYIIGSGDGVTEVSVEENSIEDIFHPGPSPACFVCSHRTVEPSFYVGDSQDGLLREVDATYNAVIRWADTGYSPYALGLDVTGEFLMVSDFREGVLRVMNVGLDPIHAGQTAAPGGVIDIEAPAGCEGLYMAEPCWESSSGNLLYATMSVPGGLSVSGTGMPGHPVGLSSSTDGAFLYVLSNTGSGTGLLTVMDVQTGAVAGTLVLDGYPWDVAAHGDGEYVLVLVAD